MNDRQVKFIEMLEKHLAKDVTLRQMDIWLTDNIKPIIFQSQARRKPGMWLEMYAYREIHWYIADLEDTSISRRPDIDWYWKEVRRILDLLLGKEIHRRTEHQVTTSSTNNKSRENDEWLLPYLNYAEQVLSTLVRIQTQENNTSTLPVLDLTFTPPPLASRTCSEFVMDEILTTIEEYKHIDDQLKTNPPDKYYSFELKLAQVSRLEKLIKCFKREAFYSVSATFEGLDKFAVIISVV